MTSRKSIASLREDDLIILALDDARGQINARMYGYQAKWLLSDYHSDVWITAYRGREKCLDGKWSNSININWNICLPNGKSLADPIYKNFLSSLKRSAFCVRSGLIGQSYSAKKWEFYVRSILKLVEWVTFHSNIFIPEKYGLQLIGQKELDDLFSQLAIGSWFYAMDVPGRILREVKKDQGGEKLAFLDKANLILSNHSAQRVIRWLEDNRYYKVVQAGPHRGRSIVDKEKLSSLLFLSNSCQGRRFAAFLRQFESDFHFTELLIPMGPDTEYPSQNTLTVMETLQSRCSIKSLEIFHDHLNTHKEVKRLLSPLHARLNSINAIPNKSYSRSKGIAKPTTRTKFIPFDIGVAYLNVAMEWVEFYGDGIISYYAEWLKNVDIIEYSLAGGTRRSTIVKMAQQRIVHKEFAFQGGRYPNLGSLVDMSILFRRGTNRRHKEIREKLSLGDAISVLIGACVITIGLLKPSRSDELTHLDHDCLIQKEDGFYIRFTLGKSNVQDAYQTVEKPIPRITAKSLQLLQKLGRVVNMNCLVKYRQAENQKLFILPTDSIGRCMTLSDGVLNQYIDRFCDFANFPAQPNGSRWYLRIHEMRKWFLLLLFWAGRYDVLEAARWIAGHTDVKHIHTYIQREFPGEELPTIEAEYAMERLIDYEENHILGGSAEPGIVGLYKNVLTYFNAAALSLIPKVEWESYISELRMCGRLVLEPHSINALKHNGEMSGVSVSFILRAEEDA